jgi:hypothetical protein
MDAHHLDAILAIASNLLRQTCDADSPIKPTDFYCEGWMTALTLAVVEETNIYLPPFNVVAGGRWWREAGLRSPFPDEGTTKVDAILGHFDRRAGTKRGIRLRPDATQLVVVEAKINSALSGKTTNATDFDQAARNVACMACELNLDEAGLSRLTSLGFYVISSAEYRMTHCALVNRASIERCVLARIDGFNTDPCRPALDQWYTNRFQPFMDKVKLECLTWEAIVKSVEKRAPGRGPMLDAFYKQCRELARRGE